MSDKILAWHFTSLEGKLRHGDGRKIVPGEVLSVDPPLIICKKGLHASRRLLDALFYAPDTMLWRVEVFGEIVEQSDKLCGTSRKALWGFDAQDMLFKFARECAIDAIGNWKAPKVVKKFLETGDLSLRHEAESAAWSVARSAAKYAARSAAESAARSAAWSAAESAAKYAARSAAWSAAGYAARCAALKKYNSRLEKMAVEYHKSLNGV